MRLLLYSQFGGIGGSTSLLLNLAKYLHPQNTVSLCFREDGKSESSRELFARYPELEFLSHHDLQGVTEPFDVALLHLPFSVDDVACVPATRKIAVAMEIAERHPPIIQPQHFEALDSLIYLHPEQVAHLPSLLRFRKCKQLPIINDIERAPPFRKTRCIGAIGHVEKISLTLLEALQVNAEGDYEFRLWSQNQEHLARELAERGADGIQVLPVELDMGQIMGAIDVLVHTPRHGNGTSMVVSDALSCGKMVVLSPLPAYRRAYGHLAGVSFSDEPWDSLAQKMASYDEAENDRIRRGYLKHYNREKALRRWRKALKAKP